MSTIKPSVGTDCAINDACDLDVRCESFQHCVVFETEQIHLEQAPYTKAGPQVEWALGYINDMYGPNGVEPEFQP